MLLAIDIGNTSINNGIFEGRLLKKSFRASLCAKRTLRGQYLKELGPYSKKIEGVLAVSVVPGLLKRVEKTLKRILKKDILVVGRDVDSGVKNLYSKPKQVGQDRLVNARAGYELYGPSIIVDFGTAITIDVVNKNREYLGGVIAPGVEVSLKALSERACLLPEVKIKKPKGILGKETEESMISGAVYGFGSLCDGIVKMLKRRHLKKGTVIATGGLSPFMAPYCKGIEKIDPYLTLKGLQMIIEERNV